jgi:hypothetical protein
LVLASGLLAQSERHFSFHYGVTVKGLSPGDKVQICAHAEPFQDVKVISAKGDLPLKKTHESVSGNEMYYASSSKGKAPDLQFEIVYEVVRREHLTLGIYAPHLEALTLSSKENKQYLSPDTLVPVTRLPAELAVKTSGGQTTPLGKARAIYDYVLANMQYDRTGTGWGARRCALCLRCQERRLCGFSFFIHRNGAIPGDPSTIRNGIFPAGWEPLRRDCRLRLLGGILRTARRMGPGRYLRGVEASRAEHYFFGALDANRVQFTVGRNLELNPRQAAQELNYFIYPYVEVQGKEYPNISLALSFSDLQVAP